MEGGDSDLNLLLSSSHPIGLAFLVFQIEMGVGIQVKFGLELKQCRVRNLHCLIRKHHQFKHPV